VADVVGRQLKHIGGSFQVLCITHLPQIAAAGHAHFRISKTVTGGRTVTRVVRLATSERVEELARMIGGAGATEATRTAARELLGESETKSKGESESATDAIRPESRAERSKKAPPVDRRSGAGRESQ
jgi:hypothetical protein